MNVQKQQRKNTAPCREGSALHHGLHGKEERVKGGTIITTGRKSLKDTLERTRRPFRLSETSITARCEQEVGLDGTTEQKQMLVQNTNP